MSLPKSKLNPIIEMTGAEITITLTPMQAAAIVVLGYHVAGMQNSLRTPFSDVAESLEHTLGFNLESPTRSLETMIASVAPYAMAEDEDVGIQFNPIDMVRVESELTDDIIAYHREF